MSHQINLTRIRAVNNALVALKEKVVFVGGATISLYAEREIFELRPILIESFVKVLDSSVILLLQL